MRHLLIGAPDRTRTYDPLVNSQLLYLLSYRGIQVFFENACKITSIFFGDPEGARTLDLQRDRLAY